MATIEERANEIYIPKDGFMNSREDYERIGYIKGATDQQKIDIEKLKDVLNALMIDTRDKERIIQAINNK